MVEFISCLHTFPTDIVPPTNLTLHPNHWLQPSECVCLPWAIYLPQVFDFLENQNMITLVNKLWSKHEILLFCRSYTLFISCYACVRPWSLWFWYQVLRPNADCIKVNKFSFVRNASSLMQSQMKRYICLVWEMFSMHVAQACIVKSSLIVKMLFLSSGAQMQLTQKHTKLSVSVNFCVV